VPLADPDEEKRIQEDNEQVCKEIDSNLPGPLYSVTEREEFQQEKPALPNPWDLSGRREMDQVAPTFEQY